MSRYPSKTARNATISILCAAFIAPNIAHANDFDTADQAHINLARYDLNNAHDLNRLHMRIVSSSHRICSPALHNVRTNQRKYRECITQAVDHAVASSRSPQLKQFHTSLSPKAQYSLHTEPPADWTTTPAKVYATAAE